MLPGLVFPARRDPPEHLERRFLSGAVPVEPVATGGMVLAGAVFPAELAVTVVECKVVTAVMAAMAATALGGLEAQAELEALAGLESTG